MRVLFGLSLIVAAVAAFLLLREPVVAPAPTAVRPTVVVAKESLAFPGATGWSEARECRASDPADACAAEWEHESGQIVRDLLMPVPDPNKLDLLAARLRQSVESQGGIVQEIAENGRFVVRMLQPAKRDEDDSDVVNISYLLTAPDKRMIHVVTAVVPLAEQQKKDTMIRDLLAFSVWVTAEATLPTTEVR